MTLWALADRAVLEVERWPTWRKNAAATAFVSPAARTRANCKRRPISVDEPWTRAIMGS